MLVRIKYIGLFVTLLTLISSCREPFEADSIEFLDALVVESTITNELKHQKVKLTRTYRLEDSDPIVEDGATVIIQDSDNTIYSFSQNQEGIYVSDDIFEAQENKSYKLLIITQDGKEYQSSEVTLTPISEISNLYAELTTKANGEQGISVLVDSDNTFGEAKYFRYNYEETYKVIAPNYFPYDIELPNLRYDDFGLIDYDIVITEREQEERVCFSSEKSIGIIQTTTNELENNLVSRFEIIFIPINSPKIRERYSIFLEQYIQSLEAYTYYKAVNELGDSNSILSQVQPGYVVGNIQSENEESEKVIGYFEAASVTSNRIYFDFSDFDIPIPDYYYECDLLTLDYDNYPERTTLYRLVNFFNYKLAAGVNNSGTIFDVVNPECGDCTTISSNIRPDFWED